METKDYDTYPNGEVRKKPGWRRPCVCGATLANPECDMKAGNFEECMAPWHGKSALHAPREPAQMELPLTPAEAEIATAAVVNLMANAEALSSRKDAVVLPKHYARFEIEPIRFICENNLNFFQGNIVKYILRWDAKNGLEDLKKAKRYLEMFIKWVEKDPDWWR